MLTSRTYVWDDEHFNSLAEVRAAIADHLGQAMPDGDVVQFKDAKGGTVERAVYGIRIRVELVRE